MTIMKIADKFNQSDFSRWINSNYGRVFRLVAGVCFLGTGLVFRHNPFGIAAIVWSILPLSAGAFDVCYISAALGGPFAGSKIREQQQKVSSPKRV